MIVYLGRVWHEGGRQELKGVSMVVRLISVSLVVAG